MTLPFRQDRYSKNKLLFAKALENAEVLLKAADSSFENIVKCTVYLLVIIILIYERI
jgi:hypothetical protein